MILVTCPYYCIPVVAPGNDHDAHEILMLEIHLLFTEANTLPMLGIVLIKLAISITCNFFMLYFLLVERKISICLALFSSASHVCQILINNKNSFGQLRHRRKWALEQANDTVCPFWL